jgi:hypothetical protein
MSNTKYILVWEIQGNYGQGWECETAEETRREALARLREYRENMPEYAHRLRATAELREASCE